MFTRSVPLVLILFSSTHLYAAIFGAVRGTVRDAQQRAVSGATVTLRLESSEWHRAVMTDRTGQFAFPAVPIGAYKIRAEAVGLSSFEQPVVLASGAALDLEIDLPVASVSEEIHVNAPAPTVDPRSSTTQTTINRTVIAETPGADRSDSMAMITEFVPGAYVVHDQLHVRGGHQVSWLIDGVPVPNANIAGSVGPQFDPKDIDYMEAQRGGYSAEYGDRTYAVFNVVPRTGFERHRDASLNLSYGSLRSTNDQFNLGDHTERFAYYASLSANRTDAGLETPIPRILHDDARGAGGFLSLVFLPTDADQLHLAASARAGDYSIPNDDDLQAAGVSDQQRERDAFVNVSWLHAISSEALLTASPFFHDNVADFRGGPHDPIVATDDHSSRYLGGQATYAWSRKSNDLRAGVFAFNQQDSQFFALRSNDDPTLAFSQREAPSGSVEALFVEERHDLTPWLTLRGGIRYTRFRGGVSESMVSPRAGAAVRLPWANAVLRASYGRYYQPPPLSTVSGPLLQFAVEQGFDFLPLRGERDEEAEAGVAVPVGGWTFDAAWFRTHARNFFDHDVLGNSGIFFPLTIDRVFIRGAEATLESPLIANRARLHVVYSHQTVEGEGAVVGGLTDFTPPEEGRFFLDHDQRQTMNAGLTLQLPLRAWFGANIGYGSGFLNGDGPDHLPGHTAIDVAAGTSWREWSFKLSALNVTNRRYLLDLSNTFGGTHYSDPREISAQVGYRFHY